MDFILYLYSRSWRLLLLGGLASLAGGISGAALIGVVTRGDHGSVATAAIFFGLCALHLFTRSLAQISLLKLTQDAVLQIRIELSRRLLAAPMRKLQELGKPELLAILTKDVESLIAGMTVLPHVMTQTVVLLCCLAYMAWLAWKLLLVFLAALIAGFVLYHFLKKEPLRQLGHLREKMGVMYGHFRNLVEGSRELQLNAERGRMFVDHVLKPDAHEFRDMYVRGYSRLSLIANFGDVLFYLVIGLILFLTPLWLSYDSHIYMAFTMVLLYLIGPISTSINAVPVIAQAVVAFHQIQRLGTALSEEEAVDEANPFDNGRAFSIQLRDVCHQYPGLSDDHRFLLGPMNLTIGAGEILFIIGGNGSGKTTLAMLLLGLYLPEQGDMVLNGVPVGAHNVKHYRSYFSAVFADFHLFRHVLDDSEQNVERERRAEYFLNKLGVGHKVRVVDGKFSTIDLSSGQRKRLALVSAYLEDRPVYLFDEWAADQDPVFKRVFYTELLPELKARGKTVIVISHDDAYFAQADRVLRLQDGQLQSLVVQADDLRASA